METGAQTAYSLASKPIKYALSAAVFYCCFILGIMMTILGPTIIDFSRKFDTTEGSVSVVFTVINASFCVGALCCGILFNFFNRTLVVMVILTAASSALFVLPHVTSITTFYILGGVIGFGGGGMDTAQVAWVIDIWRHDAGPFLLCQVFGYSVGTLATPLLIGPFLNEEDEANNSTGTTTTVESIEARNSSNLTVPFTVAGCLVAVAVVLLIALYFVLKKSSTDTESNLAKDEANINESQSELSITRKAIIVALACSFMGFYAAMELCTMSFISTFAVKSEVDLTEQEGARVLLWLTIGFAAGRGLGILAILKVAPQHILIGNFILVLSGNTILVTIGSYNETFLWIGAVILGLGFSTMYPSFYAYLEKHIFVSDSIAATVAVFAGLVATIYPLIIGNSVTETPRMMNYLNYLSFGITTISFVTLFFITRLRKPEITSKSE